MDQRSTTRYTCWRALRPKLISSAYPLSPSVSPALSPQIAEPNDSDMIAVAARIANEHGADMIKCYYSGTIDGFRQVTETNPAPVLIAGGAVMETARDVLTVVSDALHAGAHGVFFGKNIWQSADPEAMTAAMARVIHEGVTPDEAADVLMPLAAKR